MKKLNVLMGVLLVVLVGMAAVQGFASSGIADPTISLEQFSPSSGIEMKKLVLDSLESLETAVVANIDYLDTRSEELSSASVASVSAATNLTNTVTITAKDISGATIVGARVLSVWTSATAGGAASTNNIASVTASTGTTLASNGAWYDVVTGTNGTYVAAVVGTAAGTNYVNVAGPSGVVVSSAMVFTE